MLDGDPGWLREYPGVRVVESAGPGVLFEVDGTGTDGVLKEALSRGSVREFAEVRPTVAEIYREVTK
ncbi:DUF4162 domain-containing protein [Nocardia sp. NPDC058519]|uniref:ATP-binding protein DrrA1-3 family domain-containing protein n=1 Tax=Nocardia sp. NPDC058519 TaxID=3346535 RepID=UPI00365EB1D8